MRDVSEREAVESWCRGGCTKEENGDGGDTRNRKDILSTGVGYRRVRATLRVLSKRECYVATKPSLCFDTILSEISKSGRFKRSTTPRGIESKPPCSAALLQTTPVSSEPAGGEV